MLVPATAIEIASIAKCQTGKADLAGDAKVFTVQVCNLFGATCYMNHVETASTECSEQALMIENQQCALFPIMSYKDYDRSDPAKLLVGGSGGSVSCSGADCKFSGAFVSIQCSLGGDPITYAGPAMTKTGSGSARTTGIADAAAAAYEVHNFVELKVSGSKTVFLSRTGSYVATASRGRSSSGTVDYMAGELPTIAGNNYGPKACPAASTLSSAATETKEELRMCGSTGKWSYFGAANLLMDKDMSAKLSADSATGLASTKTNIPAFSFLNGNSLYQSGAAMDDSRAVYLHDGAAAADVLMTSETITPATSDGMAAQDSAGQWRFYQVAFYCDQYDRTDLTTCPEANRKIFYVADPNPAPAFGTTAASIGTGGSAATTVAPESEASGAARAMTCAAAGLVIAISVITSFAAMV
jgi:hypothetical protein